MATKTLKPKRQSRTRDNWKETGRLTARIDNPQRLQKMIQISEANGDCGPTTILNILVDSYPGE